MGKRCFEGVTGCQHAVFVCGLLLRLGVGVCFSWVCFKAVCWNREQGAFLYVMPSGRAVWGSVVYPNVVVDHLFLMEV
jgi:hypothetical protein